ncbi:MAG: hypothetical protein VW455_08100 [Nitrospinota bacterium]
MAAAPVHAMQEADYKKDWCPKHNGEVDYQTHDKSTVDCLTDTHAIEFEVGANWNPAIRKSRSSSVKTGKEPGVVLIIETEADKKHLMTLRKINEKRRLAIKIWSVGLDVELPCDIKGDINPQSGEKIYHHIGQQMYDASVVNPRHGDTWFCSYEEAEEAGFKPFVKAKPVHPQTLGGIREMY